MTLPCAICFESHVETFTLRCACGGEVDCAGSEGPTVREGGDVVRFQVTCTTCGRVFTIDTRTGTRSGVQEPMLPGGVG